MIEDAVSELVEHGHWTVANIKDAWQALKREGATELQPGTPRDLTAQERLHVIRIPQQGSVTLAIGQFLSYVLDEEAPSVNVAYDPVIEQPAIRLLSSALRLHRRTTRLRPKNESSCGATVREGRSQSRCSSRHGQHVSGMNPCTNETNCWVLASKVGANLQPKSGSTRSTTRA
jgi:hypothetical protein